MLDLPTIESQADRTLLLVDDDEAFVKRLARALEKRGFLPETAQSVAVGRGIAQSRPPAYAVVDLRLEDGSGLDVVEALRERRPDCRIVMLTGYGAIATAVAAVKSGATDYLAKPADADDVTNALLSQTNTRPPAPDNPMSADRVRWEHIQRIGGVAVIRVGGMTETEMNERKDRVDDALNATRAAVQEGIVVGGGVSLAHAARILAELSGENGDQNAGIAIVRRALEAPLRQIVDNAGHDGAFVAGKIREATDSNFGFDARSGMYGDMFGFGIIDPAKVVRSALQNAASVAGLLITTQAMIADHVEESDPENRSQDS